MNFSRVGALFGVQIEIKNFLYCVMRREKSVRPYSIPILLASRAPSLTIIVAESWLRIGGRVGQYPGSPSRTSGGLS